MRKFIEVMAAETHFNKAHRVSVAAIEIEAVIDCPPKLPGPRPRCRLYGIPGFSEGLTIDEGREEFVARLEAFLVGRFEKEHR